MPDDRKCIECGYLTVCDEYTERPFEATKLVRTKGRHQSSLGNSTPANVYCWKDSPAFKDPEKDPHAGDMWAKKPEDHFIPVLSEPRTCDDFCVWRRGRTPKEHEELLRNQSEIAEAKPEDKTGSPEYSDDELAIEEQIANARQAEKIEQQLAKDLGDLKERWDSGWARLGSTFSQWSTSATPKKNSTDVGSTIYDLARFLKENGWSNNVHLAIHNQGLEIESSDDAGVSVDLDRLKYVRVICCWLKRAFDAKTSNYIADRVAKMTPSTLYAHFAPSAEFEIKYAVNRYQTLQGRSKADDPSVAETENVGNQLPARSKNKNAGKTKVAHRRTSDEIFMAALKTHHKLDSDEFNYHPTTPRAIEELCDKKISYSTARRLMISYFGSIKSYRQKCKDEIIKAWLTLKDGGFAKTVDPNKLAEMLDENMGNEPSGEE